MKRIFARLLFIFIFFAIVGNMQLKPNRTLSPILFDNIEALSNNENNENTYCHGIGSVDCPEESSKVKYIYN